MDIDRFIHEQNLAHYRKILMETTDPKKRETLLRLLAAEHDHVVSRPSQGS